MSSSSITWAITHEPIPADWPVQPVHPALAAKTPGWATCGTCGLSWDDTVSTSMTPTPSGRCPFEQFHLPERPTTAPTTLAPPSYSHDISPDGSWTARLAFGGRPAVVVVYDPGDEADPTVWIAGANDEPVTLIPGDTIPMGRIPEVAASLADHAPTEAEAAWSRLVKLANSVSRDHDAPDLADDACDMAELVRLITDPPVALHKAPARTTAEALAEHTAGTSALAVSSSDGVYAAAVWPLRFDSAPPYRHGRWELGYVVIADGERIAWGGDLKSGTVPADAPPDLGDQLRGLGSFVAAAAERGRPRPGDFTDDTVFGDQADEACHQHADELAQLFDLLARPE